MGRPLRFLASAALFLAALAAAPAASAQAVAGTCASCSGGAPDPNCGACISNGTSCFNSLAAAERRNGVFQTSDGHDARTLTFAHLMGGVSSSASDINRAVSRDYNGSNVWLYYGAGAPPGYCAPAGGPPAAFANASDYHFGYDHRFEDTLDGLDCYNVEVDRYYMGAAGHNDGDRVCDGEQSQFDPARGAIFDLGGDGNRVAVFPYTDHGPLPCESFEYSVWLSNNPSATEVADATHPDPNKWNPSVLIRAFLQGWIPDNPAPADETAALNPDLGNATQHDGMVQVFALPCGLTFRYASVVAGNNGNPSGACTFYSFDAELDAVAGLNEDDTAICPDADHDGYRDHACGGNDCNDADPMVHPGALETCSTGRDLNCDGVVDACPTGTTCVQGFCAVGCIEGACATGFTCTTGDGGAQSCVPSACANMTCPAGQICGPSGCQDPCAGATCPAGQVCRGGACLDPCAGLLCPSHQHCGIDAMGNGVCQADCSCLPCDSPQACNPVSGRCESMGCASLPCDPPGQRDCTGATPRCVAPCQDVTCPVGNLCDMATGQCVRDGCFGVACPGGSHCASGSCVSDHPDAGTADSGVGDGGAHLDGGRTDGGRDGGSGGDTGGCGCSTAGARGEGGALALAALGLALGAVMARRRR